MDYVERMKEENIRPDYLIRENHKLLAEDIQLLMNHSNEFVKISCPACESSKQQFVFEKTGFNFVQCLECETYFINPRPSFELLVKFYESSGCIKHWKQIFSITENVRRTEIFIPRVERVIELCKRHNAPTEVLLDVGAGFGTFCEEIKKSSVFKKVIAIEPSKDLAEACRQKNVDVIEKPVENIDLNNVSVITCFELIEHLFWPKDFVNTCGQKLSKGGLFIITTPNIKGFDLLTLGKLADGITGPNHLNYFHPKSLSRLLINCGFEIIQVLTPGKLDAELVRKKILTGELGVSNQPFLKYLLIEQWETVGKAFQNFLADNTLSSHLWIVAKKS